MTRYSLTHVADHALLGDLSALVGRDRRTTAEILAYVAEVDARKLYLPAAYGSMFSYCVGELRMSEDSAARRIQAARAAMECPAIFEAVADGRLHLTAVGLLAPHLDPDTAQDLIDAAAHKTKTEILVLLAERFPKPDVPTRVICLGPVPDPVLEPEVGTMLEHSHAPAHVDHATRPARLQPIAPDRYALQVTISGATQTKLAHARALLGHAVPSGDLAEVIDRALDALIVRLERRKFAAVVRPRPRKVEPRGRYIPAEARREVWARDRGQCTFVSANGRRCEERSRLEFDHVTMRARGGEASVANLRLRCRAHNQHTAEQALGAGFMQRKREAARVRHVQSQEAAIQRDVIGALRELGFRADQVRRGAAVGAPMTGATLEQRIRAALSALSPRCTKIVPESLAKHAQREGSPAGLARGQVESGSAG